MKNSLNDLNDSNVGPGTKSTGDDKSVTNLKAKSARFSKRKSFWQEQLFHFYLLFFQLKYYFFQILSNQYL